MSWEQASIVRVTQHRLWFNKQANPNTDSSDTKRGSRKASPASSSGLNPHASMSISQPSSPGSSLTSLPFSEESPQWGWQKPGFSHYLLPAKEQSFWLAFCLARRMRDRLYEMRYSQLLQRHLCFSWTEGLWQTAGRDYKELLKQYHNQTRVLGTQGVTKVKMDPIPRRYWVNSHHKGLN